MMEIKETTDDVGMDSLTGGESSLLYQGTHNVVGFIERFKGVSEKNKYLIFGFK